MDPFVEDHLLRELVWLLDDEPPLRELHRVADACAAGVPLAGLLAAEAEEDSDEAVARQIDAMRAHPEYEEGMAVAIQLGPVSWAHDFALTLDALIGVGSLTRDDAAAFLRAHLADPAPVVVPSRTRVEAYLERVWPDLEACDAQALISGLLEAGALDDPGFEAWYERIDWRSRGTGEMTGGPGATVAVHVGPALRVAGLRVLAVEECEDGLTLHIHQAHRVPARDGSIPPLPDERGDTRVLRWPLHLADDVGTAYRGRLENAEYDGVQDDGFEHWGSEHFAPRPPAGISGLRLVDAGGQIVLGFG